MKNITLEEALRHPLFRIIGWLQGLSLLGLISSPIIWIWVSWGLAWKVGLTSLLFVNVFYWLYKKLRLSIAESIAKQGINDTLKKYAEGQSQNPPKRSKFEDRLNKMKEERRKI
jgi:hypothetical protein